MPLLRKNKICSYENYLLLQTVAFRFWINLLFFRTHDLPEERSSVFLSKRLPEAVISTNITHINNSNNITLSNDTTSFIENSTESKNVTKESVTRRKERILKTVQEYYDLRSKTHQMTKMNNVTSNTANLITKIMDSLRNLTSTEPTIMRGNDSLPYCEPYDNLGKDYYCICWSINYW